jgi:hypothetical protein
VHSTSSKNTSDGEAASSGFGISHSREEESMEAKARWFRSLTPEDRLLMLAEWTALVLEKIPA